jgi:uncharacterized protein YjgD (DUF1641 family)
MNDTMTTVNMAERLERMEKMITDLHDSVHQVPDLVAIAADTFDETVTTLDSRGVDVDTRLRGTLELIEMLTKPETLQSIQALLALANRGPDLISIGVDSLDEMMRDSNLDPIQLGTTTATVLESVQAASSMPATKAGGIFSIVGKLRDPEINLALGFIFNILKELGKNLKDKS